MGTSDHCYWPQALKAECHGSRNTAETVLYFLADKKQTDRGVFNVSANLTS